MSNWLKLYADMYTNQFKHVCEKYLKSKFLEFDHWRESIKDGHKGDVMCLLGLNYAMDMHTMVHLHGNHLWSTLHRNFTHDQMAAKCNFHLAYLSRGIYAELVKRDTPLQSCSESDDVTSLIIDTLTAEEDHTINKWVHLGIGVGIDNTDTAKNVSDDKPDTTDQTDEPKPTDTTGISEETQPSTSGYDPGDKHKQTTCVPAKADPNSKQFKGEPSTKQMMHAMYKDQLPRASIVMKLSRLNLGSSDSIMVTKEMLDSMPKSKYSVLHGIETSHDVDADQSTSEYEPTPTSLTDQHNTSTETIIYWSAEDETAEAKTCDQLQEPKWRVIHSHLSQHTANFKF